ncbi:Ni-sirohydrochlorin a,c-diamide reductive cyclase catalytic subunit [Methanothermococcus sp.]|uniref:Ni-sirohydrochlorin a,c-diamide reductive cyclase catalytic subunit n=1 Tax=Methanothermococcus sp. TaxID=2614238 RepID=UPI0025FDEE12|nr:Ni-sirohydrochlorin a,c-diamide reductive cyclase catalytic subunit [Methanothermococcus sp.]
MVTIMHPRPSSIAAAMYQLRDVGVDAIIMHGPSGCCFRTARLLELDGIRVFTTAMDENDFIFGAQKKLNNTVREVIDYLKKNKEKKNKYIIGIVGTCPSMIIGEDLYAPVDDYHDCDDVVIIPVEVHSGMNDNTLGAIKTMESCLSLGIINEKEFNRQKKMLIKATEIEKTRGMAKNKYLKPTYEDDLEEVVNLLKGLKTMDKDLKIACVLNAKKETAYLFAHPLIEINKIKNNIKNKNKNKNIDIVNIANLDKNIGFEKVRKDAENILDEYSKNNITIDYITGGLDEYPVTGRKAVDILKEINPDIVVVSGVPHALPIEELKEINKNIITIGISDGPRLYHPIKDVYNYGIIELDAHAKVLGKRTVVKSRFGEVLNYAFK